VTYIKSIWLSHNKLFSKSKLVENEILMYQRTIAKEISVTGIGIHSGKRVTMKLYPAKADSGILFKRVDIIGSQILKATALSVSATNNNTTLGSGIEVIHTVEHFLAALYGLGIDNVVCEIDGPEVPIMDGSSSSFIFLLKEAGVQYLNESKKFLVVKKTIKVSDGDSWATIEPAENLIIDSTIVFAHPVIKKQNHIFNFSCDNFINEICRARTFGMLRDVDMLKRKGLVKGGSLDNAIVLDDFRVVNSEGLRFKDEFVRHKILDIIGDISLLGNEVAGKITAYKSGHKLHNILCRQLLSDQSAYEIVNSSQLKQEQIELFKIPQAITISQ
jgi:UDP-3-O-[3-hydroxymyristoyl] N-acetylglucosamine deacetylase